MSIKPLLVLLLSVLTSCSIQALEPPEVQLLDLSMGNVYITETELNARIRIDNMSPKPLRITGSSHKITLSGVEAGRAVSGEAVTIPRFGSATQKVSIKLSNFTMVPKIRRILESNRFDYRIDSKLYTGGTFSLSSIKTTQQGSFDWLRAN